MNEWLKKNWHTVFGDSESYVEKLLSLGAEVYDTDRIASLLVLPMTCGYSKIGYIYGAMTLPEFRGRGIMAQLIKDTLKSLETKGYSAAFLLPAEESLYGYYEKLGFKADLPTDCREVSIVPTGVESELPTEREYGLLGAKNIKKPYEMYIFAARNYIECGGHFLKMDKGYVFYRCHRDRYIIDSSDEDVYDTVRYAMSVRFGDYEWDDGVHVGLLME